MLFLIKKQNKSELVARPAPDLVVGYGYPQVIETPTPCRPPTADPCDETALVQHIRLGHLSSVCTPGGLSSTSPVLPLKCALS